MRNSTSRRALSVSTNPFGSGGLLFLAALSLSCAFTDPCAGATREACVPEFTVSPQIDGYLDDYCWKEAERVDGFVEVEPREGARPDVDTQVLLGYDEHNLCIAFLCYEDEMSKIRTREAKRDTYVEGDWVQISLDTYNTSTSVYSFQVNPSGVTVDMLETLETADINFDIEWYAATRILDHMWTVEIGIPFKSLRFPSTGRQHWRVDFIRHRPRDSVAFYSWVFHTRDESSPFAGMGHLYIDSELLTSERYAILPYVVMAEGREDGFTSRLGLSGKCWLSSDFICDWAFNPDYAQIESDAPQIDVNTTFALYYPEKRPFFLERKSLFETPIQAVYTRTINDPLVALKFTGRWRQVSVGYVTALDEHTPWVVPFAQQSVSLRSDRRSVSSILRVSYDFRKESNLGILATSRELGGSYNRVFGLDGRVKLLKSYYLSLQGLLSATREPDDGSLFEGHPWLDFGEHTSGFDGEYLGGKAFALKFARNARYLDFDLWYEGYSPDFRAENGFIKENDLKSGGIDTRLTFWPNRHFVNYLTVGVKGGKTQGYHGGERKKYVKPAISLMLKKQSLLTLSYTSGRTTFQNQRFDKVWTAEGTFVSSWSRYLSPGIVYRYGREINYSAHPLELGYLYLGIMWFDFRPLSRLNLYFSYAKYLLEDKDKREVAFEQSTYQYRLTYSLSPRLTSRLIVQHDSSSREVVLSALFSFQASPFTALYLGSNHTMERLAGRLDQRGWDVYLKVQYRMWM